MQYFNIDNLWYCRVRFYGSHLPPAGNEGGMRRSGKFFFDRQTSWLRIFWENTMWQRFLQQMYTNIWPIDALSVPFKNSNPLKIMTTNMIYFSWWPWRFCVEQFQDRWNIGRCSNGIFKFAPTFLKWIEFWSIGRECYYLASLSMLRHQRGTLYRQERK